MPGPGVIPCLTVGGTAVLLSRVLPIYTPSVAREGSDVLVSSPIHIFLFFLNMHTSGHGSICFFFLIFIYFGERQRQDASWLGAEREGGTESEAGSRLRAVSTEPDAGLELTSGEIMT